MKKRPTAEEKRHWDKVAEEWRDVPGYGGHYAASSLGRVKCKERIVRKRHSSGKMMDQFYRERILGGRPDEEGYCQIHISVDGIKMNVRLHHLVLLAFRGPKPDGCLGCHNNSDPADNRPDNLRWDDQTGNMKDREDRGLYRRGESHHMAKFTDEQAAAISVLNVKEAVQEFGVSKTQYYRIRNGVRGQANG